MIILGIDPGSVKTGYGVIESDGRHNKYLGSGLIRLPAKAPFPDRLDAIFAGIEEVIGHFKPVEAAVEQVFMARNPGSALKLGQARGAALVACTRSGLIMHEYSARQIKQAVVGSGRAAKEQVQLMVKHLLNLREVPPEDAADALAAALCHGHSRELLGAVESGGAQQLRLRRGRMGRR